MKHPRLAFVDNLRTLLAVLVVLTHLAITYGAPGSWYYREVTQPGVLSFSVFAPFVAVNQAFFMALFFMIAGYFTPGAYERKGARLFLRERLVRLGIPLLMYVLVAEPVIAYALAVRTGGYRGSFGAFLAGALEHPRPSAGPLWFVAALLLFGIAYAALRPATRRRRDVDGEVPGAPAVACVALALGAITFAVRTRCPVGWSLPFVNFQCAHFPQYVTFFVLGVFAYRRNWLERIGAGAARLWAGVLALCLAVVFPLLFVLGGAPEGVVEPFLGGLTWQSLVYSTWEQFVGFGMSIVLLSVFRRSFDRAGAFARALSRSTYAAFVIHGPVLVLLALSLRGLALPALLKFALVAPIAVSLVFFVAFWLRRLPLVRAVL